jgi:phosphoribosylamine--glycine ligase
MKQNGLKVLVIGSGGREHALVWKIAQNPRVAEIFCAPGNAGIAEQAKCIPIDVMDIPKLMAFAKDNEIDLTVVGPEAPLCAGIVDHFERAGLCIFGPSALAADLEGSKRNAKEFMDQHFIPTAKWRYFYEDDFKEALKYLRISPFPLVVKSDSLAAGKGVFPCYTFEEAEQALRRILVDKEFNKKGDICIIEEFLKGEEVSFLAFSDGRNVVPLPTSQDYKKLYENDQGPNTGGMGAYSPAPIVDDQLYGKIMNRIMVRTVRAMEKSGRPYKGVLYAGLMIVEGEPYVLEFNCQFGDPETQAILMRLQTDIINIMERVIEGKLMRFSLDINPWPAVCVVMASKGYPEKYAKGFVIKGLEMADSVPHAFVFHAGTKKKMTRLSHLAVGC